MESYVKLEDVADERGESPAKVARTLVRQGCDLYLHFGEARKSRVGVSFYPDHPTERMEHNIGAGDHLLTKDSQEALIKRIGREDTSTKGLTVLVYLRHEVGQNEELSNGEIIVHDPKLETLEYQIELMEQDDTVCVVFDSEDLKFLPPLPAYQDGAVTGSPNTPEDIFFENSGKKSNNKKSNPELHKIFWRAFSSLQNGDLEPEYKQVWDAVHQEVKDEELSRDEIGFPEKRTFDPHDHIETIDPVNAPHPKLQWLIAGSGSRISQQGSYSLSSLPSLLSKLKKNPPID
mgnify:FL=1